MRQWLRTARRVLVETIHGARDDRILGLGAEVAFFALLALPSLVLLLAGVAGLIGQWISPGVVGTLQDTIIRTLGSFVAPSTMRETVEPTVEALFQQAHGGLLGIGAAVAVWSGSRLVRVLIEALNVVYDVDEWRAGWKRRLLAVGLTAGGAIVLAVFLPLVVAGPSFGAWLDQRLGNTGVIGMTWRALYWPVAGLVGVLAIAALYHTAPNRSGRWIRNLPGAALAATLWIAAAMGLRLYVRVGFEEATYGPLAAPVVMLLWFYVSGVSILMGAELNAELDRMYPQPIAVDTSEKPDADASERAEAS